MAEPQTAKETKKNNDKPAPGTPGTSGAAGSAGPPQGYKKAATDAVGFFDGDLKKPIHCIPIHVVLADSGIDKTKPSALVFVRLIDPCEAVRSGEGEGKIDERELITTKKDDVVGIWFSAGMRDLAHSGLVPTYMVQEGEKKIKGKPSPMKVYGVYTTKQGQKLEVREDRRQESAGVEAKPFAGKKIGGAEGVDSGDAGDDDIPF